MLSQYPQSSFQGSPRVAGGVSSSLRPKVPPRPFARSRNVLGTNQVCPWDKPTLAQGQTQVFSCFYTGEAQFVPGTNPVCPWDNPGDEARQKKFMC